MSCIKQMIFESHEPRTQQISFAIIVTWTYAPNVTDSHS
jgi:hypothetical protein